MTGHLSTFSDYLFSSYSMLYRGYKAIADRGEREVISRYVRPGDVAVDIGANMGCYTLYLSKIVGPEGRVYAFEPSPENYSRLAGTASAIKNISLNRAAVGDNTGTAKLYLSDMLYVDHRLYRTGDRRRSIDVDCVRLDDYFKGEDKIDFIKMDIQGFEYHAFLGMQELIRRNTNIKLIFEFWPFGLNAAGVEPFDLIGLLKEQGFNLYRIGWAGLAEFSHRKSNYGPLDYSDIFALRGCPV
jgi:FkbM family methyltransferase